MPFGSIISVQLFSINSFLINTHLFSARAMVYFSQVAAHMLPVGDPAMLITVNFFYGNVFDIVRRAKLAWLHLVQP